MASHDEDKFSLIFTKNTDIHAMQVLKELYTRAFNNKPGIQTIHQELPALFNLSVTTCARWLRSDQLMGKLPRRLLRSELSREHFFDTSISFTGSPVYDLTLSIITDGTKYIEDRELDTWRRGTSTAYESIDIPRYYLIVFICERLRTLCPQGKNPSESLVNEYECLFQFISSIIGIAHLHFPSSTNRGFHFYLSQSAEKISQIKSHIAFLAERVSLAAHLHALSNHLTNFKGRLAEFLIYAVSEESLGDSLHADYLCDDSRQLPPSFVKTDLYKMLRYALQAPGDIKPLVLASRNLGFSKLILNLDDSLQIEIIEHMNCLIRALTCFTQQSQLFNLLADNAELHGQYDMIHDAALNISLQISLHILTEFIKNTIHWIEWIALKNLTAMKGHENYRPGFTQNIQRAQARVTGLKEFLGTIQDLEREIQMRIKQITDLKPTIKSESKIELVEKVKESINELERYHMVTSETARHVMESLQYKDGKEPLGDYIMKEEPTVEIMGSSLIRHRFPEAYELMQENSDKIKTFESIIASLDHEIHVEAVEFIDGIERIHVLSEQLNLELKKLSVPSEDHLTDLHFGPIDNIYAQLREQINQTHYHQIHFVNFNVLPEFMNPIFSNREREYLLTIRRLFIGDLNFKRSSEELAVLDDLICKISDDNSERLLPLVHRIDELQRKIAMPVAPHMSIIEHYDRIISSHRAKIQIQETPLKTHSFVKPENANEIDFSILCAQLVSAKTSEDLQGKLNQLYTELKRTPFKVKHLYKNVPKNIQFILNYYEKAIPLASSFEEYKTIRNEIFMIAKEAAENPPNYCWGLFKFETRDKKTQEIYEILRSCVK